MLFLWAVKETFSPFCFNILNIFSKVNAFYIKINFYFVRGYKKMSVTSKGDLKSALEKATLDQLNAKCKRVEKFFLIDIIRRLILD
ncbi:hypothetical protein COMX_04585 [Commensalibacter papalotli (ex Servin-Garciduenas et al. 2014)]|uniref:Uncharacterized protein n=2 Tax=Commensalibacter TaxID=1079922 RepID=W7DNX6_9PROT|nr:hypothetical protein COMX_04585 [Commensalibacter papalotli (ex Servin-Garciduenas et al. 2014)]